MLGSPVGISCELGVSQTLESTGGVGWREGGVSSPWGGYGWREAGKISEGLNLEQINICGAPAGALRALEPSPFLLETSAWQEVHAQQMQNGCGGAKLREGPNGLSRGQREGTLLRPGPAEATEVTCEPRPEGWWA